jgi:predicted aconitase/predicted aconitase with swiveling domain
LHGRSLAGQILVIPSGRGSCSGSGVLLELILNGHAPAALVFSEREEILTIGVIIAARIFGKTIPIVRLSPGDHQRLSWADEAWIEDGMVHLRQPLTGDVTAAFQQEPGVTLTDDDTAFLEGRHGQAARVAMEIVLDAAAIYGATELQAVERAHIDGCIYTGSAGLRFAQQLRDWGGKVRIPTTLNAISVDYENWKQQGVDPALGASAGLLADAYVDMGAQPTFTCAPYLLDKPPRQGEQIVWAESNAVVFANSVLGARTMKYPDYLDICIALTGRAPRAGCHLDEERAPQLVVNVSLPGAIEESVFPLLGYHIGKLAASRIPLVLGLGSAGPDRDDLKAFGAAFATTAAAPMFHIGGVTPDWMSDAGGTRQPPDLPRNAVQASDLAKSWRELNGPEEVSRIGLVALGNPHFSLDEIETFAGLCASQGSIAGTSVIITCGRDIYRKAAERGLVEQLQDFGVAFVVDTCWCMIGDPLIAPDVTIILTNSAKFAHYGAGLSKRSMRFGSLAQCAATAATGCFDSRLPAWLAA